MWRIIVFILIVQLCKAQVNDPYLILGSTSNPSGMTHPKLRYLLDFRGNQVSIDTLNIPIGIHAVTIGGNIGTGQVVSKDTGYSFCSTAGMLPPYSLSIEPLDASNTADCLNGVNMLDALLIQRMVLFLDPEPSQNVNFAAADVFGNSKEITVSDTKNIQRAILGAIPCMDHGSQAYHFTNQPITPYNAPLIRTLTGITPAQPGQSITRDVYHIKVGDVNDSYACTPRQAMQECEFVLQASSVQSEPFVRFTIQSNHFEPIAAFQGEFAYDADRFEFVGIAADGDVDFTNENVFWQSEKPGQVSVAWMNPDFLRLLPVRGKLGSLLFTRKPGVSFSELPEVVVLEDRIPALVANDQMVEYRVRNSQVSNRSTLLNAQTVSDFTIAPNPTSGVCEVFLDQKCTNAMLEVYNSAGRLVQTHKLAAGSSKVLIFEESGIYMVHIKTDGFESVQKLAVFK